MRCFSTCLSIVALALAVAVFTAAVVLSSPAAPAGRVCVPSAWTERVAVDTDIINVCFNPADVMKIKPIYFGESGNMVEVILRDGTWFYKNGMTVAGMKACVAGRGACDKYQNVKLRDLTRGDTSIFKKKPLHPKRGPKIHDYSLNRDAVVSSGP